MQRESINKTTFAKGVGAAAILAASLGALTYPEYSTTAVNYSFVPGTYTASAQGMDGPVSVTITVDGSSITDVSVDVSGETAGIGAEIGDEVTSQILSTQSSAIDGVSGATVSSTAVMEALDAAIAKAEAGDTSVPETEAPETEAVQEAVESVAESSTEAAEPVMTTGSFTPGTYTASAQGIESEVTVTGTFDETALTDVTIDVSGETAGIGAETAGPLSEAILAAQSADVDGVSGATVTSDAVKTAMADVFAQAAGSGADAETAEEAPAGAYTPGTYTASAQGIESEVTVTGTFDETALTDVTIDVSGETAGLGAETGEPLAEAILAAQSADIDGVSGATITSDAVKAAMADVFAQAAAGTEAEAEDVEEVVTETAEEVEEAVTEAAKEVEEAVTETAEDVEEAVTEAAEETADDAEEAAGAYTPGTYTASAKGIESEVTVTGTFDETSLTDVTIDVSGETAGIGAETGEPLAEAILAAQSADIDGVSGATITSDAVKAAMADVFSQAAAGAEADAADEAEEAVTEAAEEVEEAVSEAAADIEITTEAVVSEIPAGYGVAVLEGSGETYDISMPAATTTASDETEAETEAIAEAAAITIDETKDGVGVAEKN